MKDFNKHPFHGVGFSDVPDVLKALQALEKHNLYKIDVPTAYSGTSHAIFPTLAVRRETFVRDVRNALVDGGIKIRDESWTKDGAYRSDWIVLDYYALRICSARRGNYVCLLEDRADCDRAMIEWNIEKPHKDKQKELLKSAFAKLTPDERRAVGISNKRGIK